MSVKKIVDVKALNRYAEFLENECEKKDTEINKLREALGFYASLACPIEGDNELIESMKDVDRDYFRGGKRARQALKGGGK